MHGPTSQPTATIGQVVEELQQRIDRLPPDQLHRRTFITTYQRTTQGVGDAIDAGFTTRESAEHAVTHLSGDELAALQRLLKDAIARRGA